MASDRTAIHESGHCWAGLRCGWAVRATTVNSGALSNGCSLITATESGTALMDRSLPWVLWPHQVRDDVEQHVLITMAGPLAVEML